MTLTREQLDVVCAPIEERQLVIAGPGTGKTHTLVARIKHLIDETQAATGQEILVLSFTRNAVREIKNRLARSEGDAAYVRASTFDSFATQTLGALTPGGTWTSEGYDGRIRELTRQLDEAPEEVLEAIGDLRHILVDEVQDLVAARAAMVKSLLTAGNFGFTLLGDPAQAIYDYQEPAPGQGTAFAEWAKARFKRMTVRTLTGNHRIKEGAARVALWAGPSLGKPKPPKTTHEKLRETYRSLPIMSGWRPLAAAAEHGKVAVLCRDNGQALMVSERLHEESIPHFLQGDASAAPIEAWLSRIFSDHSVSNITRDDLDYLLDERAPGAEVLRDEAWRALRALGRSGKLVDLPQVAARLMQRWMPDSLVQPVKERVVVSSIHRAKGLEFDHVVVIWQPNEDESDEQELLEESRVLYVALTRASRTLYRYEFGPLWGLFRRDDDRWVLKGRQNWSRRGIQLLANDVERRTALVHPDTNGVDTQEYLWSKVSRGDSVTLEADRRTALREPAYQIMHSDRCIGRTSATFAAAMHREFGKPNWWPRRVSNVRVSTVESVAGTRTEAGRAGLEGQGFWLAVRLEGLGRFDWASGRFDEPDEDGATVRQKAASGAGTTPSGSAGPPGFVPSPKDRQGRRELWARLQDLADDGDFEAIQRELPTAWEDRRPGLLDRARRAARRNNNH